MNHTYFALGTIAVFSLIMLPLYYNVAVNIIASAITISVSERDTTSITSTDDTSTDTLQLVVFKPKI